MAFGFAHPTSGLIAGRFLRPGRQHRFALDFARAYADAVTVVICGEASDAIPLQARAEWIGERFPDVSVLPVRATGFDAPASGQWAELIADALRPARFELYFAANAGEFSLGERLGAQIVPCVPGAAFAFAPGPADEQDTYAGPAAEPMSRVCLFGPESTGKSTLAQLLARHYNAVHVPEYARGYLDAVGSAGTVEDVPWIARGQRAMEIACAAQADRVLICDTNLATVKLWSDVLFGATPAWIGDAAARQRYDLWLLTDIDIPFEPDPQRCFPDPARRAWFMGECIQTLDRLGVAPVLLRGSGDARLSLARAAVDWILARNPGRRPVASGL